MNPAVDRGRESFPPRGVACARPLPARGRDGGAADHHRSQRCVERRALGWYREIILAGAFLGMAAWELIEMWALERPPAAAWPLGLVMHALQVALILAATYAVLRAWQDKSAREAELARLVEKVIFAQEEERRRIACELHDGVAQLIVSAKQHVDTCGDLWRDDAARALRELVAGSDRLQRAIVETRRVLMALRPSAIDAIGLVNAARTVLDEAAQEAGWAVRFVERMPEARVPPTVETAAFRILQEALANARKHARTSRIEVELGGDEDWLRLDVRDHGVGVADAAGRSRGLGLLSMRERARLLGGVCTIESAPGRGTRVRARLPMRVA